MKRFDEARVLLEDTVVVVKRTLGGRHVGMVMTKGNLVRACVLGGDWKRAKELLTDLQEIVPKEHPKNHPDNLHLQWGWAYVKLHLYQDLDGAREHCERVRQAVAETKVLSMDNPRVLDTAEMLPRIYQGESREDDVKRLKSMFPRVGMGETRSSIDFLPLKNLIRRRMQERPGDVRETG